MRDLWPEDFEHDIVATPLTILKEQASLLGLKTRNIVEGEVTQDDDNPFTESGKFYFTFYVVAPALNNYRYRLFTINHDIGLYPISLGVNGDIMNEIEPGTETNYLEINSEEDFLIILSKIFNAKKTRRIIGALISQSGGLTTLTTDEEIPF